MFRLDRKALAQKSDSEEAGTGATALKLALEDAKALARHHESKASHLGELVLLSCLSWLG